MDEKSPSTESPSGQQHEPEQIILLTLFIILENEIYNAVEHWAFLLADLARKPTVSHTKLYTVQYVKQMRKQHASYHAQYIYIEHCRIWRLLSDNTSSARSVALQLCRIAAYLLIIVWSSSHIHWCLYGGIFAWWYKLATTSQKVIDACNTSFQCSWNRRHSPHHNALPFCCFRYVNFDRTATLLVPSL